MAKRVNRSPGLSDIVEICLRLDQLSQKTYRFFSDHSETTAIRRFWAHMSREEASHVSFWADTLKAIELIEIPTIFEDISLVSKELLEREAEAGAMLAEAKEDLDIKTMFLIALRLEFYLLHPAIGTLFQHLSPYTNVENPADAYDRHINQFLKALARYGQLTPEMELLGKSLERLWADNRKLGQLAQLATRDYLTGLLNRRGFKDMAFQLAILAARSLSPISLLMIDIDKFKKFNDRFGHSTGDHVIGAVSDAMISSLRGSDLICRWGGEEFVALLPSTEPEDALQVAEKLLNSIRKIQQKGMGITVSIGVAGGPIPKACEGVLDEMIERADAALYMAKKQGRDRCVLNKQSLTKELI